MNSFSVVVFVVTCKLLCFYFIGVIWVHYDSWITNQNWSFVYLPWYGVYIFIVCLTLWMRSEHFDQIKTIYEINLRCKKTETKETNDKKE